MTLIRFSLVWVCAATVIAAAQEPSTYEEVLQVIDQIDADRTTWQADVELDMTVGGRNMAFTGVTKNKGDLSRTEMNLNMAGITSDIVTLTDANNVQWTQMTRGGVQQVMKIDMNRIAETLGPEVLESVPMGTGPGTPIDVRQSARELLSDYEESFELTYLGTGTHSDAKVYLIEGKRSSGGEATGVAADLERAGLKVDEIKVSIGTEDGFLRSIEWFGDQHQTIMKLIYDNVILGPTFPDEAFKYTPAEGVRVADMTPMMEQQLRRSRQP